MKAQRLAKEKGFEPGSPSNMMGPGHITLVLCWSSAYKDRSQVPSETIALKSKFRSTSAVLGINISLVKSVKWC